MTKKSIMKALSLFRTSCGGGVAIMGAFAVGLIATATVASMEVAEVSETKAKMQDRLDAAVLFATLRDDLDDPDVNTALQTDTHAFFVRAVEKAGFRVENVTGTFSYDPQADRVYGEATFTASPMFTGGLLGGSTITLRAEGAPKQPVELEIALVLDVSGSMKWEIDQDDVDAAIGSRRIDALSDGVEALVARLEDDDRVEPKFTVIPYATSVDLTDLFDSAGASKSAWFEGLDGAGLPNVCIGGRAADPANCDPISNPELHLIANPSPVGAWPAERYETKVGSTFTLSLDPPAATKKMPLITQGPRTSECDPDNIDPFGQECVELLDNYTNDAGYHYVEHDYFAPRTGLLGLTEEPDDVRSFMATLEPRGATAGHIGTAWGLYALTPEWSGIFNHPAGAPDAFGTRTQKVVVIMTDGDLTIAHDSAMNIDDSYEYFQAVCQLARSQEVAIYAVGLRSSTKTDDELTECTGNESKYYSADTRGDLIDAFDEIAKDAANVRLTN